MAVPYAVSSKTTGTDLTRTVKKKIKKRQRDGHTDGNLVSVVLGFFGETTAPLGAQHAHYIDLGKEAGYCIHLNKEAELLHTYKHGGLWYTAVSR